MDYRLLTTVSNFTTRSGYLPQLPRDQILEYSQTTYRIYCFQCNYSPSRHSQSAELIHQIQLHCLSPLKIPLFETLLGKHYSNFSYLGVSSMSTTAISRNIPNQLNIMDRLRLISTLQRNLVTFYLRQSESMKVPALSTHPWTLPTTGF